MRNMLTLLHAKMAPKLMVLNLREAPCIERIKLLNYCCGRKERYE